MGRIVRTPHIYLTSMGINSTLLCIHRDPAELTLLQENGYELVTATNGSEGLRLLMSRPVDAIVLEYHLGLLDGAVVAAEIRKVKPQLPIVMLVDHLELPEGALESVDALVSKADGAHFLWATIHSVLNGKPVKTELGVQTPGGPRRPHVPGERLDICKPNPPPPATDERQAPFSSGVWRSILDGSVKI